MSHSSLHGYQPTAGRGGETYTSPGPTSPAAVSAPVLRVAGTVAGPTVSHRVPGSTAPVPAVRRSSVVLAVCSTRGLSINTVVSFVVLAVVGGRTLEDSPVLVVFVKLAM